MRSISWLLFVLAIISYSKSFAASPQLQEISLKGKLTQVTVSPADTKRVVFYALTSGNSTQPFSVSLEGPQGMTFEASLATLKEIPTEQVLIDRDFWKIPLKSSKQANRESTSNCLGFAPGETTNEAPPIARPESNSPLCDLFSESDFQALAQTLSTTYGGEWTHAQVCGYLVENYFGGTEQCDPNDPECIALGGGQPQAATTGTYPKMASTSDTQRIFGFGLFRKDACAKRKTKYLARFIVDLATVDPQLYPTVTLTIQAMEFKYSGDKAASLKPKSDGRFAPQPILLMTFLGTLCGQKLDVIKWAKGKPRQTTPVRLGDLLPYNGRILTRSPIGGVLNGGKGSFDLTTARNAYGVCFELVRRRQKVNGY